MGCLLVTYDPGYHILHRPQRAVYVIYHITLYINTAIDVASNTLAGVAHLLLLIVLSQNTI